ncbi:alpha/beta hydrolase [Arsenicicoccus sp. UBA7492]|uniref:alpha/beta hydrolase n=1 Tax=Arsenicicoccus sp. UBA7492 TaxID=1946057 RepID=UPI00257D2C9D|nr:alpha/beta hydrolase-fold protein [Arsenicicoccus sp. UBA7492]
MELTGGPFVARAITVTTVALITGAILTGRTRRTVWGAVQRALAMVLVAVLAVLSVAIVLNAQNQWYVDWGDLAGTNDPTAHATTTGGSAGAIYGATPAPRPSASRASLPPLPSPNDRVQTFQVTGRRSGLTGRVVVLLPEDYAAPAQARRDYPVVMTMHGYPGSPDQWLDAPQGRERIDAAVTRGKVAPLVMVSPQLDFPKGTDSERVNAPGGAQVETWLTQDVPELVRSRLRVRTDRASWASAGFSAGGYCAAMVAVRHPQTFGAGVVLGGYGRPTFSGRHVLRTQQQKDAYDLPHLLTTTRPPVALWVQTSDGDPVSYAGSTALAASAKAPTSVTLVMAPGTGHRTSVWSRHFAQALEWLGRTVPGFAVGGAAGRAA